MKVTLQLTLDGLVRAMRLKAHEVADRVETQAQAENRAARVKEGSARKRRGGDDDDRDA